MEVLTKQATELIEGEKILLKDELAVLKREAAGFLEVRDALAEKVTVTAAKLKEAQVPLTEEQRGDRRLAEQNDRDRPPGLVRIRRHASWERRLAAAEQEHQSVTASLAEATRQADQGPRRGGARRGAPPSRAFSPAYRDLPAAAASKAPGRRRAESPACRVPGGSGVA
jgi:hypothetical protein